MIRVLLDELYAGDHAHTLYLYIDPRGSLWLPWPHRSSVWWWEVHEEVGDCCEAGITHAYDPGGSGGAWFLSRAIRKAARYADTITEPTV